MKFHEITNKDKELIKVALNTLKTVLEHLSGGLDI